MATLYKCLVCKKVTPHQKVGFNITKKGDKHRAKCKLCGTTHYIK
jgi:hypothetical protein